MIRVMVLESEAGLRHGLAALLEGTDGFSCAGAYSDCKRFLTDVAYRRPEVVLIDLEQPGQCGVAAIRETLKSRPEALVLVLTRRDDDDLIFQSLAAGAAGYLTKPIAPARLLEAIHEAYRGGAPMSSPVARKVVRFFRNGSLRSPESAADAISLTRRERDVLTSLAEGKSYKEIAHTSQTSVNTVRYHIRNLYDKLQVHTQSEAVAKGMRQGLI